LKLHYAILQKKKFPQWFVFAPLAVNELKQATKCPSKNALEISDFEHILSLTESSNLSRFLRARPVCFARLVNLYRTVVLPYILPPITLTCVVSIRNASTA